MLLSEEIKNGKILKWDAPEPRYYKLIDGKLFFSDDLRNWNRSNYDWSEEFDEFNNFSIMKSINHSINNYMTVKEASYRWGVDCRTLREKLNIKRRPSLQKDLDKGLVKYFKHPEAKQGEWILSTDAMVLWYGNEPIKGGEKVSEWNNYETLKHYKGMVWVSKTFETEKRGNICALINGVFRVLAYISPDKLENKDLLTIINEVIISNGTPYMLINE